MTIEPFHSISPIMLQILEHASKSATIARPVLIIGERGTGKELIAQRLHYLSPRWQQPFVTVNCAALSEDLLDSELFGHEQGSFTGATKKKIGRFEIASEGTLFLDEIGLMSTRLQEKLLRVLEYGEFQRVGGSTTLNAKPRVIGATNEDLPRQVARGKFRADLMDRLSFDVITLPPLRARRADILYLAEKFGLAMTKELKLAQFSDFSAEAKKAMINAPWPGNVRQLKNVVERAVFFHGDNSSPITEVIIDPFASPFRPKQVAETQDGSAKTHLPDRPAEPVATSHALYSLASFGSTDLKGEVATMEQKAIAHALTLTHHHQKDAAERLGISYHALRGMLKKYPQLLEPAVQNSDKNEAAT